MEDKEFQRLSNYKQSLEVNGGQRPMSFYEKYIKKTKENKETKEPKTAIWWMIMIFCLVYGFEVVYKALIAGGAP